MILFSHNFPLLALAQPLSSQNFKQPHTPAYWGFMAAGGLADVVCALVLRSLSLSPCEVRLHGVYFPLGHNERNVSNQEPSPSHFTTASSFRLRLQQIYCLHASVVRRPEESLALSYYLLNCKRSYDWLGPLSTFYATGLSKSTCRSLYFLILNMGTISGSWYYYYIEISNCFFHNLIATSYWLDDRDVRVRVPVGSRIFTSPCRSDRLWGPSNLLSHAYRGLFPRGKAIGAWSWPLTSNKCRGQENVGLHIHYPIRLHCIVLK
jgi:hypothetical protein